MSSATPSSIDLAALIVSLGVLIVASLSDLKTREVSNRFWIIYAPIAAVLFIGRIVLAPDTAAILLVSAAATIVVAFLLSISMMFILLGKNVLSRPSAGKGLFQGFEKESILRKALVLLTSYKTSFNVLQTSTHLYPAEQVSVVDSRPVRQLHLVSSVDEERDKLVAGLQGYKEQGLFSDGVWVTPGLPHLVFMTASLVVTVVIGDLLMWLFFRAVGVS